MPDYEDFQFSDPKNTRKTSKIILSLVGMFEQVYIPADKLKKIIYGFAESVIFSPGKVVLQNDVTHSKWKSCNLDS